MRATTNHPSNSIGDGGKHKNSFHESTSGRVSKPSFHRYVFVCPMLSLALGRVGDSAINGHLSVDATRKAKCYLDWREIIGPMFESIFGRLVDLSVRALARRKDVQGPRIIYDACPNKSASICAGTTAEELRNK